MENQHDEPTEQNHFVHHIQKLISAHKEFKQIEEKAYPHWLIELADFSILLTNDGFSMPYQEMDLEEAFQTIAFLEDLRYKWYVEMFDTPQRSRSRCVYAGQLRENLREALHLYVSIFCKKWERPKEMLFYTGFCKLLTEILIEVSYLGGVEKILNDISLEQLVLRLGFWGIRVEECQQSGLIMLLQSLILPLEYYVKNIAVPKSNCLLISLNFQGSFSKLVSEQAATSNLLIVRDYTFLNSGMARRMIEGRDWCKVEYIIQKDGLNCSEEAFVCKKVDGWKVSKLFTTYNRFLELRNNYASSQKHSGKSKHGLHPNAVMARASLESFKQLQTYLKIKIPKEYQWDSLQENPQAEKYQDFLWMPTSQVVFLSAGGLLSSVDCSFSICMINLGPTDIEITVVPRNERKKLKAQVLKETGKGLKSNNIYFDSAWCLIRSIPCYKAIIHQGDIVSVPACSIYCLRSFDNGVLLRWQWSTRDKMLFDTCVQKNRRISKQKLKWKSEMYDNLIERRNMSRDTSRRIFC